MGQPGPRVATSTQAWWMVSVHGQQLLKGLILLWAYGRASEKISNFSEKQNGYGRIPREV